MSNEWPINNNEKEISLEEKLKLIGAWQELVLDLEKPYNKSEKLSEEEIKDWMYESMMEDIGILCDEWRITIDEKLIESIRQEEDVKIRANLELKYIKDCHGKVDERVCKFDRTKSTKWDSWPKKMRESGQFNCVGASLVGLNLLNRAGIENYWGNPIGHAVNIVKLSNGDWWYVDFLNGEKDVLKIEPEKGNLMGVDVLRINNSYLEYKLIPIFGKKEAVGSVLGNFFAIKCEAENENLPNSKDKNESREYLKKYSKQFSEIDFEGLYNKYFKKQAGIKKAKEMEAEQDGIDEVRSFYEGPVREYVESLSNEQRKRYKEEAELNLKGMADFFLDDNEEVLKKVGLELRRILELYKEVLRNINNDNREEYERIILRLIYKQS